MLRLLTIAVVCTFLLIPIAGFSSNIISNRLLLIAVSFSLAYVVIPCCLLRLWPAKRSKKHKSMDSALHDGELHTAEYKVCAVVQIEETEDEGLHFLVATESGATLCLSGQYLLGPVKRGTFPSEKIRVFRNSRTALSYGMEPIGQAIKEWPVYEPLAIQVASDIGFEDGGLYAVSIDAFLAKLGVRPVEPVAEALPR